MSSLLHSAVSFFSSSAAPASSHHLLLSPGIPFYGALKHERIEHDIGCLITCYAISKSHTQGNIITEYITEDHHADKDRETQKVSIPKEIKELVKIIKSTLNSIEDGDINISAYDTAWVALVKDVNDNRRPQFPQSLEWIANNQLADGSWGDADIFQTHDRILNTLACVVALTSWNLHSDKCELGLKFFNENLSKLEDENVVHMPVGFEVVFPSLLELAARLNLEIPHQQNSVLRQIYAARNLKLKKIPKEILHTVPTALLYSLEGMDGLDWGKLIKLQSQDGSFLFSPASTAYALSHTNDQNCFVYLSKLVDKFHGGVPNVYPVDLFENIWVIDRLQRLGISRYFRSEIRNCVDYIEKYWDDRGICWARNSEVHDIDDTSMGFRILRLHSRNVSTDVFKNFEKDGEFFCLAGQSNQAITGFLNMYKASQLLFPGEKIMEKAREYTQKFLKKNQASNELVDKWIITKDLPGEVGYALDLPFYASLPRVESRFYLEQYGGEEDVWIGKTLYRLPIVNNNTYLELAKMDYNNCQEMHMIEWGNLQKWYDKCGIGVFGVSKRRLLFGYYVAAATVFEPDRSEERMAWAKTNALLEAIQSYFHISNNSPKDQRSAFVHEFIHVGKKTVHELVKLVLGTLDRISLDNQVAHGRNIRNALYRTWEEWMVKWEEEGDRYVGEAELVVETLRLTSSNYSFGDPLYRQLTDLTNTVCHQLAHFHNDGSPGRTTSPEIERGMQELVRLVTQNEEVNDESKFKKQTFLDVAKTFYYTAVCDPATIDHHIPKVLFQRVC